MSHSRKKIPIGGITGAGSEKEEKRKANRKTRRVVKEALHNSPGPEVLPHLKEVSDTWTMSKDVKIYFGRGDGAKKRMRK